MSFTVSTLIGNNVSVYENSLTRVKFTATLTVGDPTLQNPVVKIESLNLIDISSSDGSHFENKTIPLLTDDNGQLTAFVDGRVPPDATEIILVGSTTSDNVTGTLQSSNVPVSLITGLKSTIFVVPVPTMQTAPKDDMKPAEDTDGKYSKQLKVKVTYDEAGTDTPYENYLVEWSPLYHANFPHTFNVYDSKTATLPLTPITDVEANVFYHTSTDADGIATLYVVSKKAMASDTIFANIIPGIKKQVLSFASVSYNISDATLTLRSPDLIWSDPIILDSDTPQKLLVTIKYGSAVAEEVYLFLNEIYEDKNTVSVAGEPIQTFIRRTDLLSTTDPIDKPDLDNIMFYAVAQKGVVRTSERRAFQAEGPIDPAEPEDEDRTLPSPYLINHTKTINADFIKGGIQIYIPKKKEDDEPVFKVDDKVTGKVFIKGYEAGSNRQKNAVLESATFEVTDDDLKPDSEKEFTVYIPEEKLHGFDSNSRGAAGIAKLEYIVERPGVFKKLYSLLYVCDIDTVPPIKNDLDIADIL
jgi:hypothetical protein